MISHILKPGCVKECPACPHRHLGYDESLAAKQEWVIKSMREFAPLVDKIRGVSENKLWNYRSKVCLSAEYEDKAWKIGIRRKEQIYAIHDCPVHDTTVNLNIKLLISVLPEKEKFPLAYYMQSGAQLTLVVKCKNLPDLSWLDDKTTKKLKENGIEGLWLHLHPSAGKKVIGKGGWHLIAGKPRSLNTTGLIYGPSSFQQVIPELYSDSLAKAVDFLTPDFNSAVIDLYCGIGASLQRWIKSGSQTIGVELSGEALECASQNAPEADLLRGSCRHRIPQLEEYVQKANSKNKETLMYVNPPRTGLEAEVTEWISKELHPGKIAYLSCSAGTLHRDLKYMQEYGLTVKRIIPYDFFPHTLHVEMLALIEKIQ